MERTFDLNGRVWLEIKGEKVLGHGRVELLQRIHESGSIRQAALQMKMSYRQAWALIKHINSFFDEPVVLSHRGGIKGGNAIVTQKGFLLMAEFYKLLENFKKFIAQNIDILNTNLNKEDN